MLADTIEQVSGLPSEAMDDSGHHVFVVAPQIFDDHPEAYLFVHRIGSRLCLCDDGEVLLHLGWADIPGITALVQAHGLMLHEGEIELWCDESQLAPALRQYLAAMQALAARDIQRRERQQLSPSLSR